MDDLKGVPDEQEAVGSEVGAVQGGSARVWRRVQARGGADAVGRPPASSVAERLGLSSTNLLYRWKREQLERSGPVATSLEARVRELELELHRVERERDILKKALAIFGRHE